MATTRIACILAVCRIVECNYSEGGEGKPTIADWNATVDGRSTSKAKVAAKVGPKRGKPQ